MKKAYCIVSIVPFQKNNYYNVNGIHSVFKKNDFITLEYFDIKTNLTYLCRFRLNKSTSYIDDYLGMNEFYFYDYFIDIKTDRLNKLNKLKIV